MQVIFPCPVCQAVTRTSIENSGDSLSCEHCEWTRPVSENCLREDRPTRCLACGCDDLWEQKDFPQRLGLLLVGLGTLLSTIAIFYYRPILAIGILMVFALGDMLLFALMRDVLVCYRCGTRHRHIESNAEHPRFNLELAERYRQEALRLEQSAAPRKS